MTGHFVAFFKSYSIKLAMRKGKGFIWGKQRKGVNKGDVLGRVLQEECIGKSFIWGMDWKGFYSKKAKEKGFNGRMHRKEFSKRNALGRVLWHFLPLLIEIYLLFVVFSS